LFFVSYLFVQFCVSCLFEHVVLLCLICVISVSYFTACSKKPIAFKINNIIALLIICYERRRVASAAKGKLMSSFRIY
jgi:hypothetical protein